MKTFFERFLDEIQRKLDAGEVDEERSQEMVGALQERLKKYAEQNPTAPIVQMPVTH